MLNTTSLSTKELFYQSSYHYVHSVVIWVPATLVCVPQADAEMLNTINGIADFKLSTRYCRLTGW